MDVQSLLGFVRYAAVRVDALAGLRVLTGLWPRHIELGQLEARRLLLIEL